MSTYEISRLLYSLREPGNREACRADSEAYYRRYDLSESERQLLLKPDWQGLVDAGVSIYLLTKLGATLSVDLLEVGASMRGMCRVLPSLAARRSTSGSSLVTPGVWRWPATSRIHSKKN